MDFPAQLGDLEIEWTMKHADTAYGRIRLEDVGSRVGYRALRPFGAGSLRRAE